MAILQMNFFSNSLMRSVPVTVILPVDRRAYLGEPDHSSCPYKTLYLLHGLHGDSMDWLSGTQIQAFAEKHFLAVVMPAGENGFYLDRPKEYNRYGSYVGEELVEITRRAFPLSRRREDTFIGGLSMGGFGALRCGLRYHETFGAVAALSSALIMEDNRRKTGTDFIFTDRAYAEACFGDLDAAMESDKNPLWLVRQLKQQGAEIPALYLACGTEDSLLPNNEAFVRALEEIEVPVTWKTAPGGHDWDFWNSQIRQVIDHWLPVEPEFQG